VDKSIAVVFNKPITVNNTDGIVLLDVLTGYFIPCRLDVTGTVLKITPLNGLAYSQSYELSIIAGSVAAETGALLENTFSISFTTMPKPKDAPLTIVFTDPTNGSTVVPVDQNHVVPIIVEMCSDATAGSNFSRIALTDEQGTNIPIKTSIMGNLLHITPSPAITWGTRYTVSIPAGAIQDPYGNSLQTDYTFSFKTVELPTGTFGDIIGHWAQHDIEVMAGLGIAQGVGNQQFDPDDNVSRAEFLSLLLRSLGMYTGSVTEAPFSDVTTTDRYAPYLQTAYDAGIIKGRPDGALDPLGNGTRAEGVVMLKRMLQVAGLLPSYV
jgi:hypothetical protein